MVKCERLQGEEEPLQRSKDVELTLAQLKPGFLVSAKVSKVFENGLELSFVGGLLGSVFADHVDTDVTSYKVGVKCTARIISVDPVTKRVALSMKSHLVQWQSTEPEAVVGSKYEHFKVLKTLYGGSYLVRLGDTQVTAFLHKTHALEEKPEEGAKCEHEVRVKEINWFDGMPIVTLKESLLQTQSLSYRQLKTGQILDATILSVDAKGHFIKLSLNEFVTGTLSLEHMQE